MLRKTYRGLHGRTFLGMLRDAYRGAQTCAFLGMLPMLRKATNASNALTIGWCYKGAGVIFQLFADGNRPDAQSIQMQVAHHGNRIPGICHLSERPANERRKKSEQSRSGRNREMSRESKASWDLPISIDGLSRTTATGRSRHRLHASRERKSSENGATNNNKHSIR